MAGAVFSIVQSISFAYAPGGEPHPETDPLNFADPARAVTVKGVADMEDQVLAASGIEGIVTAGRSGTSGRSPVRRALWRWRPPRRRRQCCRRRARPA
jgi:hypothetical protein